MARRALRSPKAFIDRTLSLTLLKDTSALKDPKASRCALALTLIIRYMLIEYEFHLSSLPLGGPPLVCEAPDTNAFGERGAPAGGRGALGAINFLVAS